MATARTPKITGAFQGAMPRHTPRGCRSPIANEPGLLAGITSPVICVVMEAASRIMPAARKTLKPAHGPVAPVSVIIKLVKSVVFESSISAAFSSTARLAEGPSCDHAGNAAAAASTALLASLTVEAAARVATSMVTGSVRSKVAPPSA